MDALDRKRPFASVMTVRNVFLHIVMTALIFVGCGRKEESGALDSGTADHNEVCLEEQATELGISFTHSDDGVTDYFFPSIMTGGAALLDLDQDGRLDVLLLSSQRGIQTRENQSPNGAISAKLYLQRENGRFDDRTTGSGLDQLGYATGCTGGDVNNDGRIDLYVTTHGRDHLFFNEGDGRFRNITESSGITNDRWGTSAAFLDFDRDGWLDLFVANYVDYDPGVLCTSPGGQPDFCNPARFPGTSDRLFRNVTGDDPSRSEVRFTDVTLESGIASAQGAGLGVIAADFNGDGWIDIYVANDGHGNVLWINQQNGTFEDQAVLKGVAYDPVGQGQGSMGLSLGDLNGDGLPEILVTNLDGESNAAYTSQSTGDGYRDTSLASGISAASFGMTGFGIALSDIENDGDLDLIVANGRVRRKAAREDSGFTKSEFLRDQPGQEELFWKAYTEPSSLLRQSGAVFAAETSPKNQLVNTAAVARSLCPGDINNDGLLDFLVTYLDRPTAIYINRTNPSGYWLSVRLIEPQMGGRDAIGAQVTLISGEHRQNRWLFGGGSYQCVSDLRLHFGLGADEQYDALDVVWPDGDQERFPGGQASQFVTLNHGSGLSR
jgi:hypothetical protein